MTTELTRRWRKLYEAQVLRAGERLAQVMVELLTHRKHAINQRHGRGHQHPRLRHQWRHLVTNVFIAVPTALLWLLLLHWHFHGRLRWPWQATTASHRKE